MSTTVPFAPLTHSELNRRHEDARDSAGHRVANALRGGGSFDERDIALLRELGAESDTYLDAAKVRCGGQS